MAESHECVAMHVCMFRRTIQDRAVNTYLDNCILYQVFKTAVQNSQFLSLIWNSYFQVYFFPISKHWSLNQCLLHLREFHITFLNLKFFLRHALYSDQYGNLFQENFKVSISLGFLIVSQLQVGHKGID